MNFKEIAKNTLTNGPSRVIINGDGEATTSRRAREQFGISPDIIFIRDDGWSLAAPRQFEATAYGMWPDKWISFIRRPSIEAKPISEYKS